MNPWDKRYATSEYIFGREPSRFLVEREHYFKPGQVALMIADGEGRNGVYLARLGLRVHAVDSSSAALRKARKLAEEAGVQPVFELADVTNWEWYQDAYDHVIGVMIQFAEPSVRAQLLSDMKSAVKPGGYLMLHGYRPEQVELGTGGPPDPEFMYTEELLRDAFSDFEIVELISEDRVDLDDSGAERLSALISLVAQRPS